MPGRRRLRGALRAGLTVLLLLLPGCALHLPAVLQDPFAGATLPQGAKLRQLGSVEGVDQPLAAQILGSVWFVLTPGKFGGRNLVVRGLDKSGAVVPQEPGL